MDAGAWDARYAASELVWSAEPNRFVAEEFGALPAGRALDLAAGEGRNAIWLASRGWAVTAVDFSSVAIDKAHRLAATAEITVDWVVADVREYEPAPAAFDAVLIAYLQLPAAQLAAVLRRAVSALAPAGVLLVVGHDRANIAEGIGGPQDPDVLHTAEGLVAELRGLQIERAGQVRRPVATENVTGEAIDTLVRARRP